MGALLFCTASYGLELPCVGQVSSGRRQLNVIGTVHSPSSKQQTDVAELIRSTRPDVVLVELDQPRLEGLLEEQQSSAGALTYGAELAQAVVVAGECNIPVVLGDAILPLEALWRDRPFLDPRRFAHALRLSLRPQYPSADVTVRRVAIARTLADPEKALPLLTSVALTIGLIVASVATGSQHDAASAAAAIADATADTTGAVLNGVGAAVGVAVPLAVLLRFVDVLLLSRDEVLAQNALRALEMGDAIRGGRLLRRTFEFSTRPATLAAQNAALLRRDRDGADSSSVGSGGGGDGRGVGGGGGGGGGGLLPEGTLPFLTLRSPLLEGEVRRVNLFEPRWLAMMDVVRTLATETPDGSGDGVGVSEGEGDADGVGGGGGAGSARGDHPLVGATFGTMHVVNRFYKPVEWVTAGEIGSVAADLVVNPRQARRARVLRAEEGARPVSGAPRLAIFIRGEEALEVAPETVRPTESGFLTATARGVAEEAAAAARGEAGAAAHASTARDGDGGRGERGAGDATASTVSAVCVVCVVGLAHANGVVARCAEQGLLSAAEQGGVDAEVARALRERGGAAGIAELGWEEYDRALERL